MRDADRTRRLRLAQAHAPKPPHAPTEAQWRGVRRALEHVQEVGLIGLVPAFEIRWVDPSDPEPGFPVHRARAMTAFRDDGSAIVCFRLDQSETSIYRSALHEVCHLLDADAILDGRLDHDEYESRARRFVSRLADWP